MGDIAEMMLDGILDEQTGEYIGDGVGYPRTRQSGFYNSMKKGKPKKNINHPIQDKQLGGIHLVGKTLLVKNYGKCTITDYVGKRGMKRYVVIDENGEQHKVKFSSLEFIKIK